MHHLPVHETLVLLESDRERGLSSDEATHRLQRHGPNVLPRVERRGAVLRLRLQFHHPLIYVLLVAAAVTYAVGEPVDASVILGVVIANAAKAQAVLAPETVLADRANMLFLRNAGHRRPRHRHRGNHRRRPKLGLIHRLLGETPISPPR